MRTPSIITFALLFITTAQVRNDLPNPHTIFWPFFCEELEVVKILILEIVLLSSLYSYTNLQECRSSQLSRNHEHLKMQNLQNSKFAV